MLLTGLSSIFILNYKPKKKEEKKELLVTKKEDKEEPQAMELLKVDIKGEIINPGIYSLTSTSRVIDQTTPNMIQKLNLLFARKPVISKEL